MFQKLAVVMCNTLAIAFCEKNLMYFNVFFSVKIIFFNVFVSVQIFDTIKIFHDMHSL